ncbi:hypothetical protein [Actinophytocola sediminis]
MARNAIPGLQTGRSVMSKMIGFAVVLAILVIVVKHPADAASFAKTLFGGLGAIIDGLVSFFRTLIG